MINRTTIKKLVKEYIDMYPVTIEFSTHQRDLPKLFDRLKKHTPQELAWTAHTCSTCVEHHGEGFVHIELHKVDSIYAGYDSSNLLYTTKDTMI